MSATVTQIRKTARTVTQLRKTARAAKEFIDDLKDAGATLQIASPADVLMTRRDGQTEAFTPKEQGMDVGAGQLRAFVERIERLEEEKKAIADDIKDVYAEAKGTGYDTKILKKVIAERKIEPAKRQEQQALFDLYLAALGMIPKSS